MSIQRALVGCHTILHLATKIPPARYATKRGAWDENNRIRVEGTRVLVDNALASGVTTFVYPSVCFTYVDRGSEWIETGAAIDDARSPVLTSTVIAEQEVERFTAEGGRGIVLRMGYFYGPRAANTRDALAMARFGIAMLLGPAGAYLPQIWVDDAASAVVAACEAAPAGLYNVVDDDPLTRGAVALAMASALEHRRLVIPPMFLVRLMGGRHVEPLTRSQRVSNRQFKVATGWRPDVPSAREGWAQMGATPTSHTSTSA